MSALPSARKRPAAAGKGAIELVEEAVLLLREAPRRAWAAYAAGSVPFVLGLLYFWADMSRSAFAAGHAVAAALGLAALFIWMKSWQAVFAAELRAGITRSPPPDWTPRRLARLVAVQAALQPYGLLAIPLAMGAMLPFYAVHAFYQNVTVCGDGATANLRETTTRAWRQALLWPRQNHILIWLVSPSFLIVPLSPLGIVVVGNVAALLIGLPFLWQLFTGEQTHFTLSGMQAFANTTFLTTLFGLSYLLLDPLCKAAHVLRVFYGEAVVSGADLRAELQEYCRPPSGRLLLGLLVLALALLAPRPGGAATPSAAPPPATVAAPAEDTRRLDAAIDTVLARPEYAWRMPRERLQPAAGATSLWGAFFERMGDAIEKGAKAVGRFLAALRRWMQTHLRRRPSESSHPAAEWQSSIQLLLFLALALLACVLGLFLYRLWRRRRAMAPRVQAQPVATVAALLQEELPADRLPAESWMALARELLAKGETRLGLRAMFLGALAHLSQAGRLSVARGKSNRDYRRELERKAHDLPEMLDAFARNVALIERVWYGAHPASAAQVEEFLAAQQGILSVPLPPDGRQGQGVRP